MRVCSIEDCDKKHLAKGYCHMHYLRLKRNGDPLKIIRTLEHGGKCTIEGCDNTHHAKGYCNSHYMKKFRKGDPLFFDEKFNHHEKCAVEGCEEKYCAKGYCQVHYLRFRNYGDPLKGGPYINRKHNGKCSVDGCEGKYVGKGLCKIHYTREYKKKNPLKFNIANQQRRAMKKNSVLNDLSEIDWLETLKHFNNKCAYCNRKSDKNLHKEHIIPLSKDGSNTKTNIIPACESCNCSKQDTLLEIWYPKQKFYSKKREQKIYKWMGYKLEEGILQATLF